MIVGTGVDVVDMERIAAVLARQGRRFVRRILTPEEEAVFEQATPGRQRQYLAGRFAIKEAVAKAFGTGIGGCIGWHDILTAHENGRPTAKLSAAAQRRWKQMPALVRVVQRSDGPAGGGRSSVAGGDLETGIWETLNIHVSISHERRFVVAQTVVEWNAAIPNPSCQIPKHK